MISIICSKLHGKSLVELEREKERARVRALIAAPNETAADSSGISSNHAHSKRRKPVAELCDGNCNVVEEEQTPRSYI